MMLMLSIQGIHIKIRNAHFIKWYVFKEFINFDHCKASDIERACRYSLIKSKHKFKTLSERGNAYLDNVEIEQTCKKWIHVTKSHT